MPYALVHVSISAQILDCLICYTLSVIVFFNVDLDVFPVGWGIVGIESAQFSLE
jgi:hypothetical protein